MLNFQLMFTVPDSLTSIMQYCAVLCPTLIHITFRVSLDIFHCTLRDWNTSWNVTACWLSTFCTHSCNPSMEEEILEVNATRCLAAHTGISQASVHRILKEQWLYPCHRVSTT
jgi:hypothetical protein